MFGNTYPLAGIDVMSERRRNPGLAEFVRLEFRPADQSTVMFALRRASHVRPTRKPKRGLRWRIRSWLATLEPDRVSIQP